MTPQPGDGVSREDQHVRRDYRGHGPERERFERLMGPPNENGCRLWLGPVNHRGYGMFRPDGILRTAAPQRANRVAYRMFVGPIPPGLFVCHRCDTPGCVEPKHLFAATQSENMLDAVAKGRQFPTCKHLGEQR